MIMLEINTKAPNFTLLDQDGNQVSLNDFLGKKVVLYFYPKDNTPGCTKQACNFSTLQNDFEKLNTVVLGISKDSVSSHDKFRNKYSLNITLLADPELIAIKAYDVWQEKMNYGKKYMGIVRTTYLINEEGIITKALSKVNAEQNPMEMLEYIK